MDIRVVCFAWVPLCVVGTNAILHAPRGQYFLGGHPIWNIRLPHQGALHVYRGFLDKRERVIPRNRLAETQGEHLPPCVLFHKHRDDRNARIGRGVHSPSRRFPRGSSEMQHWFFRPVGARVIGCVRFPGVALEDSLHPWLHSVAAPRLTQRKTHDSPRH